MYYLLTSKDSQISVQLLYFYDLPLLSSYWTRNDLEYVGYYKYISDKEIRQTTSWGELNHAWVEATREKNEKKKYI